MLVVADLLGVPEEDHQRFREGFGLSRSPGEVGAGEEGSPGENPLAWLDEWFAEYIEDRRRQPRKDVLTDLALATYADGTTPEVSAVVRTATFLFAAGQETSARLLAAALKHLAEHPELQDDLRADSARIPGFLEEVLRIESPVKADFRMARRTTSVGGVEIAAGTPVMLLNGAANRDPRQFECPAEFRADRPNAQSHVAFGRGAHSCPGGPLARAEGRISIERILDRTRNIRLSEQHHGPPGARRFQYEPTWILRGLSNAVPRVRRGGGRPMSRVAVVTGGASGIGLGVAHGFVADGHRVALVDSNAEAAETAAAGAAPRGSDRHRGGGRRGRPGRGGSRVRPHSERARTGGDPRHQRRDRVRSPPCSTSPRRDGTGSSASTSPAPSPACRPPCPTCSPPGGGAS